MRNNIFKKLTAITLTAAMSLSVMQTSVFAESGSYSGDVEHTHDASCLQSEHDHEDEHGHTDIHCGETYTGNGVTVAVLDSGITSVKTIKSVSYVSDDTYGKHGNEMAETLYRYIPDADILDVKVLDSTGRGTYSDVSDGIKWSVDNGADIIVMSFVGYEASSILRNAVEYAEENDVLLISAAGNDASDKAVYPAIYPSVISVGALSEDGYISNYSNFGQTTDTYIYAEGGTSYAAQAFAGIVAQYMEEEPDMTNAAIREKFMGSKEKTYTISDTDVDAIVYATACSHSFNGSYSTTRSATCTSSGTKVGKCTKCGTVISTVTIPATGHSWTTVSSTSATCTSSGRTVKRCTRCGTQSTSTTYPTGHRSSGSYVVTKAATCASTGTKVMKCTKCSTTLTTQTIPKTTSHNFNGSFSTSKSPTCTATGLKEGKCTRCGTVISTVTIPAKGHSWTTVSSTSATCTSSGRTVKRCTRCGTQSTSTTNPTGHRSSGSYVVTKAATCASTGTKVMKCTKCSTTLTTQTIPKTTSHNFNGSFSTSKSPTCTATGLKEGKCTKCSAVVSSVTIPALGHNKSTSYVITKNPTCTVNGTQVKKCTRCAVVMETAAVTAPGHTFNGSYSTTKSATCTATGLKEGKCTKCSAVVSTVTIPKIAHTNVLISKTLDCEKGDTYYYRCSVCGTNTTETESPRGSHTFNGSYNTVREASCTVSGLKEGKCTKCSKVVSTIVTEGKHNNKLISEKTATCTEGGYKAYKCSTCGETTTQQFSPKGHKASTNEAARKDPTCTTDGYVRWHCASCQNGIVTETLPALGGSHSFNGQYTCVTKETCTTPGYYEGICTKAGCRTVLSTKNVDATGHNHKETYKEEPTYKKNGFIKYVCQNTGCKDSYVDVLDALVLSEDKEDYQVYVCDELNYYGVISDPDIGSHILSYDKNRDVYICSFCGTEFAGLKTLDEEILSKDDLALMYSIDKMIEYYESKGEYAEAYALRKMADGIRSGYYGDDFYFCPIHENDNYNCNCTSYDYFKGIDGKFISPDSFDVDVTEYDLSDFEVEISINKATDMDVLLSVGVEAGARMAADAIVEKIITDYVDVNLKLNGVDLDTLPLTEKEIKELKKAIGAGVKDAGLTASPDIIAAEVAKSVTKAGLEAVIGKIPVIGTAYEVGSFAAEYCKAFQESAKDTILPGTYLVNMTIREQTDNSADVTDSYFCVYYDYEEYTYKFYNPFEGYIVFDDVQSMEAYINKRVYPGHEFYNLSQFGNSGTIVYYDCVDSNDQEKKNIESYNLSSGVWYTSD